MNWQTFKNTLLQNPSRALQFEYAENTRVKPSYHITEIKQAAVTSVDCGGKMNGWTEIIVQLWEPEEPQSDRAMSAEKAAKIIQVVENALPLHPEGIVKFEFGNADFQTRQMHPSSFMVEGEDLVVNLRPDTVQCKAQDRGETCGKPKVKLKELTVLATATEEAACCGGSSCCN